MKSEYNILFVIPPYEVFRNIKSENYPVGIGYLASVLREDGFTNVNVLNLDEEIFEGSVTRLNKSWLTNVTEAEFLFLAVENDSHPVWKKFTYWFNQIKPKILGVQSTFLTVQSALKLAKISKSIDPDCTIIFGGAGPTLAPEKYLFSNSCVDYVVCGEGEQSMTELINALYNNDIVKAKSLSGVNYLDGETIVSNRTSPFIRNLDSIPFPDPSLSVTYNYDNKESYLMTSRGCPYSCAFCSNMWGHRVRYRSAENVVQELNFLVTKHNKSRFWIYDDTFTVNQKRITDICRLIKENNLNIKFVCNIRADCINREILDMLKDAGCTTVTMGVESGSERVLKLLNKGVTTERIKKSAELVHESGINLKVSFMVGLPGESFEEMDQTVDLVKSIDPFRADLHIYIPYPKTTLYEYMIENGFGNEKDTDITTLHGLKNYNKLFSSEPFPVYQQKIQDVFSIFDSHNVTKKSFNLFGD